MTSLIPYFLLVPLLGFFISLAIPASKEKLISGAAFSIIGIHMIGFWAFVAYWLFNGHPVLDVRNVSLFKTTGYDFYFDFYFDKVSATYLFVGSFLTFLVAIYSRAYLHREKGYKRFFNTILMFYFSLNLVVLSGNLETLTVGWEILGISSFLLIAFYRERYLPVKNAVKVFSIYRIGDVGLLLAMWMSHHLWHENISFMKLNDSIAVQEHLESHYSIGIFISLMLLATAAAKSAQLPFSSWLPRAMEGPTPSSAIFYGSLSVHLGAFLLMRTYEFWDHLPAIRILIACLGLFTSIVATFIARVQSSIKSQVAYASITQIGIIFIEIAAGYEKLALFHFAGNAFLRTYQLLVSPSVVSYLIREQFFNFNPKRNPTFSFLSKKMQYSLYVFSLKEWNLGLLMNRLYWNPQKVIGQRLEFLTVKGLFIFFIPAYILGLVCLYTEAFIPPTLHDYLPAMFALIGLVMVLKAFTERKSTYMAWFLIIMSHFWITLAIVFNEPITMEEILFYLSGIVVSAFIGFLVLLNLKSREHDISLNRFRGHAFEHPWLSFIFLVSCLGLSGFPITPTFIGEDLIFSHIHGNQLGLALFVSLSFITAGLALIRIYSRIFLGPHIKTYHEIAYRSS
ncbi:MAG: proton-conducting transporter membrane subunit [Bacteroidia bacterium]